MSDIDPIVKAVPERAGLRAFMAKDRETLTVTYVPETPAPAPEKPLRPPRRITIPFDFGRLITFHDPGTMSNVIVDMKMRTISFDWVDEED